MATPRKPTRATTDAIDQFCARFDDLLNRRAARQAFRHSLIGLLLPRDLVTKHGVSRGYVFTLLRRLRAEHSTGK